ncbi:MAG: hypothetical protein OXC92_05440 [Flavobacteriaceae bacterium]|nr:hypothetical protein [Flavobacteriaceae bacterium]MCY4216409.1 hypothetical protein [Flavobacteriaceae bacterium]MCY4253720.1 hypothetical protein [Flavobacteriaceae bacterium]
MVTKRFNALILNQSYLEFFLLKASNPKGKNSINNPILVNNDTRIDKRIKATLHDQNGGLFI